MAVCSSAELGWCAVPPVYEHCMCCELITELYKEGACTESLGCETGMAATMPLMLFLLFFQASCFPCKWCTLRRCEALAKYRWNITLSSGTFRTDSTTDNADAALDATAVCAQLNLPGALYRRSMSTDCAARLTLSYIREAPALNHWSMEPAGQLRCYSCYIYCPFRLVNPNYRI